MKQLSDFQNEPIVNPWNDPEMKKGLLAGIEKARTLLKKPHHLLIEENWVTGEEGSFTNVNPNNKSETFGPFPIASLKQAGLAMEAAKQFQKDWAKIPYQLRANKMRIIRKRFEEEKWTLMGFLMLEVGKTGLEAYADWAEAVDFLDYYARSCEGIYDPEFLHVTKLAQHKTRLLPKPIGVGVSLPPFNFPCAILIGMWAAPTVMGNVIVIKPSPRAPGIGIFIAQMLHKEGAPVQLVTDGHDHHKVSQWLVAHPDIALITFTGSRKAGWEINKVAAETSVHWIKRVVAEMGGCDFIAAHDIGNMETFLDAVQASALGFQGQKCSALSRLIVKEDLYEQVKEGVLRRLQNIRPKDVMHADSVLGGVVDERSLKALTEQVQVVQKSGAKILLGGGADSSYSGFGMLPTVHEGLDPFSKEGSMEIFGPVFGLYKAKNFSEMIQIANATPYALTGAFFTQDPELQKRASEFTTGNTYINRKCTGAYVGAEPFGGWYGSGTDDKAGHWSHLLRFIQWQTISEKIK